MHTKKNNGKPIFDLLWNQCSESIAKNCLDTCFHFPPKFSLSKIVCDLLCVALFLCYLLLPPNRLQSHITKDCSVLLYSREIYTNARSHTHLHTPYLCRSSFQLSVSVEGRWVGKKVVNRMASWLDGSVDRNLEGRRWGSWEEKQNYTVKAELLSSMVWKLACVCYLFAFFASCRFSQRPRPAAISYPFLLFFLFCL